MFSLVSQVPLDLVSIPPLVSLTVGVFEESVSSEYHSRQGIDHSLVVRSVLGPWLMAAQRCLGVNDLFKVDEVQFKVMAAEPAFGCVSVDTDILCYKTLTFNRVDTLTFFIIQPTDLAEDQHNPVFHHYFFDHPRHIHHRTLHSEQYFNINGVESVIAMCQPDNGVIMGSDINLRSVRCPPMFVIQLSPFLDTLPADASADLLQCYLKPFFTGWRRIVHSRENLSIDGIDFKAVGCSEGVGYVGPLTEIQLLPRVAIRELEAQIDQLIMNQMEGPRGTGNGKVDLLPVEKLTTKPQSEENRSCVICFDDFEVGESVKRLPCSDS